MAKNRLIIEYEYDFDLFGLISPSKDYKLAWLINQQLGIHLVKEDDIRISFLNDEELVISNYLFETEHAQLRLLRNRSEDPKDDRMNYLVPEMNRFDYLIIKRGEIGDYDDKTWLKKIQHLKEIQYVARMDLEKLKSRENLIF